jgi:hypothetical protein
MKLTNTKKQRPLVDSHVKALAERFMEDYRIPSPAERPFWLTDPTQRAAFEDATWDLAATIQRAIEDWTTDAVETKRLEER